MNGKRNLKNIVFTLLGQIVVLGLALAVPRFMLTGYGSDTNGLVSTVTQIMAYMAMLEAGIGRATRNELYKYIHDNVYDTKNVSRIVSISQNTYRRTTRLYAFIVIILAAVLPFILKTDADHLTVLLIILIEGASGIVSFYFVQCWTDLLAAEGKQYVSSNIDLMYRVLICAVKIIMAAAGVNIIFMELGFFAATIVKLLFFRIYVRKNYSWLNITKDTKRTQLPDKNSFMVAEIAWTVFSSTDMIVLSVFCSTKISSVYSIYYMVFITINKLIDAIFTSLKFNLGQKYHADSEGYKKMHDMFNSVFLGTVTSLTAVAYYLCIPFVRLYTAGISDADYIDTALPMGFSLVLLLSWCRMVAEHLNGIAGFARQLGKISVIEAAVNLTLSVVLVNFLGIHGVLYATVIALPLKIFYCNILADKKILKRSGSVTCRILLTNLLLFFALAALKGFISLNVDSYGQFLVKGLGLTLCSLMLFFTANLFANKDFVVQIRQFASFRNRQNKQ